MTHRVTIGAAWIALGGCTERFPLEHGLFSFAVSLPAGGEEATGSPEAPLDYVSGRSCDLADPCPEPEVCYLSQCVFEATLEVVPMGTDGEPYAYTGPVRYRVTPGDVMDASTVVYAELGEIPPVTVHLARSVGKSHVWFEADGYIPSPYDYSQCADGLDNDQNGLVDQTDPGCTAVDDDLEAAINLATGVSPTFHFANPRIRDLQFTDAIQSSPLVGEQVRLGGGTLVVANVGANGFYVVDLAENTADRLYNGLFVFTYSKPKYIEYGERLCGLSGAVQEHVGMTQLIFPSYDTEYESGKCKVFPGYDPKAGVPEAWSLSELLTKEDPTAGHTTYLEAVYANSLLLERYEGNLIRFSDIAVSTRFIACDKNLNGKIDLGTPEYACRGACQEDLMCTDLEGFFEYQQYAGITAGKKKIYGSTALADEFRPLKITFIGGEDQNRRCTKEVTPEGFVQYLCPPLTLKSLTGSLRHIYLCSPDSDESKCDLQFWVADPRFDGDVGVAEEETQ
jgi:hypothetical protein